MSNAYPEWRRLEELLQNIANLGVEKLNADEILEFGRWYRRAAAELSFHRTHDADPDQLEYLNELVGRCYPYVYSAPTRPLPNVWRFFSHDFPSAFRRHGFFIFIAFLTSMLPAIIGGAITLQDRSLADQLMSPEQLTAYDNVAKRHDKPSDWMPLVERPETASFIMTNNIKVTLVAFAGGMTLGLLTLFVLLGNGLMLGVVATIVFQHGPQTASSFWGFVAPHGVFELTAIFISGGAGLLLAYAIINPGSQPRRIALRDAGKEAVILMLGVIAMLLIAGCIEAFFSPLKTVKDGTKFIVAGIEAILLFGYLFFAGHGVNSASPSEMTLMEPLPPL